MNKKVLHSVIDHVSELYKERTAIEEIGRTITYGNLRDYSNRIGHALVRCDVTQGMVVGVYLPTGIDYVSSILGVNKAGGMFMPMELSYPIKRLTYLLERAAPRIVITKADHVEGILEICKESPNGLRIDTLILVSDEEGSIEILALEKGEITSRQSETFSQEPLQVEVDGDDSNYLIYTSGSTGEPKIIEGCHKSLSHFMHWEKAEFLLNENVRISQLAPLSFDASFRDIFVPLISGGCLCVPDENIKGNMISLLKWMGDSRISVLHTVPSLFRQIINTLTENKLLKAEIQSIRHILLAGEALYHKDVIAWQQVAGEGAAEIVNLYGPSETTLIKTFHRVGTSMDAPGAIVSIGKPISNSFVIIARNDKLCEVGDIGEIYIKTPFRSKGYYKDDKQTAERFIQNPVHNEYEDIVYHTGDLGRYAENRDIEFIGRQDSQVKIRGNRVELSEVEKVVMAYPDIDHAVLLVIKEREDDVLVCYYTEHNVVEESMLRAYVHDYLPEYMYPSYYVRMEEFPTNINGKIDRKSLPKPDEVLRKEFEYEEPITDTEKKLEAIWTTILKIDRIGRKASFFQLGGTSLKGIQIISRIYKEFNTLIAIADVFSSPTIAELAVVVEKSIKSTYREVPLVAEQDTYDLSHLQKALWTQHQVTGSLAYHMLGGCYLEDLDKKAFEKAFDTLIERHESLRTSFVNDSGEPRQKIHSIGAFDFQIKYEDLTNVVDREAEIARYLHLETTTPFNLETGPLVRAKLLRLEDDRHLFLFNMHHIISDGWSVGILVKEVLALYGAYRKGEENPFGPLRIQYKDYAGWQNSLVSDSSAKHYRSFWHEKLSGEIPSLNLPTDYPRPEIRTYEGAKYVIKLNGELSDKIRKWCESTESSLFIFFLGVLNLELYYLTDEKDIIIGSPVAGRNHPDLENQIGLYLNYLILRNSINRTLSFKEFLLNIKEATLDAFEYQEYPYERLVEELKPTTLPGRNPFYDVLLVMNNSGFNGEQEEIDQLSEIVKASDFGVEDKTSKLDLSFFINDESEVSIVVEYSTELFKEETIITIEEDLLKVVNKVLLEEESRLGDIIWELSGYDSDYIQDERISEPAIPLLHTVIDSYAETHEERTAIEEEERVQSYGQLRNYSNKIAHVLIGEGVGKGDVIGVFLKSGIDYIGSILGVNKSGGIFMPLDPSYPVKRLEYLLEKVSPRIIITHESYIEALLHLYSEAACEIPFYTIVLISGEHDGIEIVSVENGVLKARHLVEEESGPVEVSIGGDDSNYLIYTSGSTGQPKIIEGSHKGLSHFVHWEKSTFLLDENVKVSQLAPLTFDASFRDIFVPLISGGVVCLPDPDTKGNMVSLLKWIGEKQISMLHMVPSLFRQLTRTLKENEPLQREIVSLKNVLLAGEPLYWKDVEEWRQVAGGDIEITNLYGPSETTLIKTYYRVGANQGDLQMMLPIGKPISNTSVLIMSDGEICNVGSSGELYIKTPFMTKGYYQDMAQTQERFIQNPWCSDGDEILYKTGDIGRYLADDNIEFVGRVDSQVKISGNRVELSEVEKTLKGYSGINEVVVVLMKGEEEDDLVCYFTSSTPIEESGLRSYAKEYLPDYMHPSYYVSMVEFPLNINGKIDKRSLPKPQGILRKEFVYEEVVTETEIKLEQIWKDVLKAELIGRKASFFQLGGTSLKAIQIISRIYKEFDTLIAIGDIFTHPSIAALALIIEQSAKSSYADIPLVELQDSYVLSHGQRRLWILDKLMPGDVSYNIGEALMLRGNLDRESFERSFQALVERHESLRTLFITVDGEPHQQIQKESAFQLVYKDLREDPAKVSHVAQLVEAESAKPFNLEHGPLLRAQLIQTDNDEYVFLFTMHHIISDGWSMTVLVKEILTLYSNYAKRSSISLPPLRIQYKDYAAWQHKQLGGERLKSHREYWLNQFKEVPVLELPTDYPRPQVKTSVGNVVDIEIGQEESKALESLSVEKGVSLFTMLVTSVKVLLYKYTSQEDIVIGTPILGRDHRDLEDQIGLYINMLALRTQLRGTMSFEEAISQVKATVLGAYDHQIYPFDKLVDEFNLSRDMSRMPLFDVMIVLQDFEDAIADDEFPLSIENYPRTVVSSKYDISFIFRPTSSGLLVSIEYNTDLFKKERIERLCTHFQNLVNAIIASPSTALSELSYLTPSEVHQQLKEFNDTDTTYPHNKTLHALFEEQAHAYPESTAVEFEGVSLSYKDLNDRANQLAHYLREKYDIQTDDLIGLKVDRSEWMIISILGILKAGAAYVPIDPDYPENRIAYIVSNDAIKAVIAEAKVEEQYELDKPVIYKDDWSEIADAPTHNPAHISSPTDLAYVIYTSGSTGNPKGVMIDHGGAVNRIDWMWHQYDFTQADVVFQKTTFTFDVSVWEIFLTLCYGAKLVLCHKEVIYDPLQICNLIEKHGITTLHFVPSMLSAFLDQVTEETSKQLQTLRHVIASGEALPVPTVRKHYEKLGIPLHNLYGPTEASVDVTYYETSSHDENIPIGRPIWNTKMYVLDNAQHLLPLGSVGEICISGRGLARGYAGSPEQTQASFKSNPYEDGARLYLTGDLGRWREDGVIEYLGRKDHQVKVKGYRIELGEIENALLKNPNIIEAVVLVKGESESKYLKAYISCDESLEIDHVRFELAKILPEYMIPSRYLKIDKFPTTSSGKIDRRALSEMEGDVLESKIFTLPETDLEEKLLPIWKSILQLDKVSTTDNYFSLGGDSIKAIKLVSEMNKELSIGLKIADLFRNPSIIEMGAFIPKLPSGNSMESARSVGLGKIDELKELILKDPQASKFLPEQYEDIYPLVPIESGMIYSSLMRIEEPVYYDQFVYFLDSNNEDLLKLGVEALVKRHSILRTKYYLQRFKEPIKVVLPEIEVPLSFEDLSSLGKESQEEVIRAYQKADLSWRLSFDGDILWRIKVFSLSPTECFVVWSFHHAMLDGWSVHTFNVEIAKILSEGREALPPLANSYKDYCAIVLGRQTTSEVTDYWRNTLEGYSRSKLPFNYSGKQHSDELGMRVVKSSGDKELLHKLQQISNENRVSLKSVFVGAYVYLMHIICCEDDLVAGIVTHDRPEIEDGDKILGCFLNTIPIRIRVRELSNYLELIQKANHYLNEVKQYEIHLTHVAQAIGEKASLSNPIFDCLLNYTDFSSELGNEEPLNHGPNIVGAEMTNTLFDLEVSTTRGALSLLIKYAPSYFKKSEIAYALELYRRILKQIASSPISTLTTASLLAEEERNELLYEFNNTTSAYSKERTLHQLFEDQAIKQPSQIAIKSGNEELSYDELNKKSNQLSRYLMSLGVSAGDNVALITGRNTEMIIGMLGILKSGAAYVPIDPEYPCDRQEYIIDNSNVSCILMDAEYPIQTEYKGQAQFVFTKDSAILEKETSNPNLDKASTDLAYTIYTSGSTGRPKGVMIAHHSAVNLVEWVNNEFSVGVNDRILFITSMCFDLSVYDIFGTLAAGATIVIATRDQIQDVSELKNLLVEERITFWDSVPTTLNYLVGALEADDQPFVQSDLRLAFMSGDWIPVSLPERTQKFFPAVEVISLGGATEGTVWSNYFPIKEVKEEWVSIPYGKPIANNFFYILDEHLNVVPKGVAGELYIGGVGVAEGYAMDKEKTDYSFVADPFHKHLGGRMYRTGDLGRMLPDGNMEFLGRKDHQVKIRGFRVELGEIENQLIKHPHLKEAVVDARKDLNNDNYLCAYIVYKLPISSGELKSYLSEVLPSYMIPTHFIELDKLPLTSNGKINRKALPEPTEMLKELVYEAPANAQEEQLASLWSQVLGITPVGVSTSFFELGGHSLNAIRVISQIQKDLGKEISLKDFFEYPTIRELSELLNTKEEIAYQLIEPVSEQEHYEVSHEQKRLWITDQVYGSMQYNIPGGCYINRALDVAVFEKVFQTIVSRHEILRTTFIDVEGEPRQVVHPSDNYNLSFTYHDLASDLSKESQVEELIDLEQTTPFNLRKGPLARFKLIKIEEEKYVFLFNMHHIISDGWSQTVLIREILVLYESFINGKENPFEPLRIHYKDYAAWQNALISDSALKNYKAYWHEKLSGEIPVLKLPTDFKRSSTKTHEGDQHVVTFSKELSDEIRKLCTVNESSLFMFLLSILNLELYVLTDEKDIVVGSPVAGRNHSDLENQIGSFLNYLVLRNNVSRGKTFKEFLSDVKNVTLEAYHYQEYPYDKLVDELKPETPDGRNPFYDVLLVMNNAGISGSEDDIEQLQKLLAVTELETDQEGTSKLDLSFIVKDETKISICIEYNTALFQEKTVVKIGADLEQIVRLVLDNDEMNLGDIAWTLSGGDKGELLGNTIDEISENF